MVRRRYHLGFVAAGFLAGLVVSAQPKPVRETVRVPMRDGVRLATDIYRVPSGAQVPSILIRTPYGKGNSLTRNQQALVEAGYAVIVQDVRGRFDSEGLFDPLRQESGDGSDTLNWIARQPWSNARIGMTGGSYLGIVQWKAALSGNPHLQAISPVVAGWDDYLDRFYSPGGAIKLGHRLLWLAANTRALGLPMPDFSSYTRHLPLVTADQAATGRSNPLWQEALEHPAYDTYWRALSTRERIASVRVPALIVGGWYDNFVQSDLEAFAALQHLGRPVQAVIGPWAHNMSDRLGIDFGPGSGAPVSQYQIEWFNRWVKQDKTKAKFAPLRIFVMGRNQWREEQEWPLARAVSTPYYLDAGGVLRNRPASRGGSEQFTYDPADPVPTFGGSVCCNPRIFPWGPFDQRPVEQRRDVLTFTTPPLDEDLELTGPVKAMLHVATSARDTDFTAKLVDVFPDGRAINLTDGILRLRYREGLHRVTLAEPGRVYAIALDMGVTSNVFRAGHRLRVEISSSNFPRFDRNLNTGGPIGRETRGVTARQTLYLGPSHLLLPVIP